MAKPPSRETINKYAMHELKELVEVASNVLQLKEKARDDILFEIELQAIEREIPFEELLASILNEKPKKVK